MAALVGAILIYRAISPPDWVEPTIGRCPEGVEWVAAVADGPRCPEGLNRYVLGPFAYELDGVPWAPGRLRSLTSGVRWKSAERYGVLAWDRDGRVLFWWIGPDRVRRPPAWRLLVGGGTAEFRLPSAERAQAPPEAVWGRWGLPGP